LYTKHLWRFLTNSFFFVNPSSRIFYQVEMLSKKYIFNLKKKKGNLNSCPVNHETLDKSAFENCN